jgi:hypothetical protein
MQLENTNVSSAAARAAVAHTTRPTSLTFPGAVTSIYIREGLVGFYRGIGPALLLCSHGAIQILAYEELKALWKQGVDKWSTLGHIVPSHSEPFLTGAAAKLVASAFTYPLQVRTSDLSVLVAIVAWPASFGVKGEVAVCHVRVLRDIAFIEMIACPQQSPHMQEAIYVNEDAEHTTAVLIPLK